MNLEGSQQSVNASKSHILIISPSLKVGGIERALTTLAVEFVEAGLRVSFIACLPGKAHFELDSRVELLRSKIRYRNKWDKLAFYIRLLFFLRERTSALRPDAVLSFGDVLNPLVLLALYGSDNRVYISDRTSPDFKLHPLARFLKKRLYSRATGLIAQTRFVATVQSEIYGEDLRIAVIPNAIRKVKTPAKQERKPNILYVGRLSWEKGVDRLIEAFARLKGEVGWTLDVVGTGPEESALRERVRKLGIQERVRFHGLVRDTESYYLKASIFVLPSHVEGFPNAMCEAMSAGLPVVCFESIPFEEIFDQEESGIAVESDNILALSQAIQRLVQDGRLRKEIGSKAKRAVQRFNEKEVAQQYLEFMRLA